MLYIYIYIEIVSLLFIQFYLVWLRIFSITYVVNNNNVNVYPRFDLINFVNVLHELITLYLYLLFVLLL